MIFRRVLSFLIVLLVFVVGCEKSPQLTPIPEHGTIVAFGDSLTAGVGAKQTHSYPRVLAELSGRTVINAGISGEVTEQGRLRFVSVLEGNAPQVVILLEGGNDILRSMNLATTKQNLAWMIETAQQFGSEVVLLGVPTKSLFLDVAPLYNQLAAEYQLVYDEELVADLLRTPGYKSDAIHLNAEGYQALAKAIYALLVERGAL